MVSLRSDEKLSTRRQDPQSVYFRKVFRGVFQVFAVVLGPAETSGLGLERVFDRGGQFVYGVSAWFPGKIEELEDKWVLRCLVIHFFITIETSRPNGNARKQIESKFWELQWDANLSTLKIPELLLSVITLDFFTWLSMS